MSSTGKSTLGAALAKALSMPFIDGDSFHPKSNIDKMSSGIPLTDEDRDPWLETIRTKAEHLCVEQQHGISENQDHTEGRMGVVIACSALKKIYRDILRGRIQGPDVEDHLQPTHPDLLPTYFVYIKGSEDEIRKRMEARQGHFMKIGMLESQLKTLESPEGENGVVIVPLEKTIDEQVAIAKKELEDLISGTLKK